MVYRIVRERGYCAVVDESGEFILSADTEAEAWREVDALEREMDLD